MNSKEFRAELVKIMPGYDWTVHQSSVDWRMEATGTQSSGSNRLSTLSVTRIEKEGEKPTYEAKSSGYGRRARWLHTNKGGTLARALRGLQDYYEATASTHYSHAGALKQGRRAKESPAAHHVHPDDAAVDRFAAALKGKLAEARQKGRGGWEDKEQVSGEELSDMLVAHTAKGDPRDVAAFCMFLHQRGEAIQASPPKPGMRNEDAEAALRQIAAAIQKHQAEGGISTRDAMSEIIAIVESTPMQINTGRSE